MASSASNAQVQVSGVEEGTLASRLVNEATLFYKDLQRIQRGTKKANRAMRNWIQQPVHARDSPQTVITHFENTIAAVDEEDQETVDFKELADRQEMLSEVFEYWKEGFATDRAKT